MLRHDLHKDGIELIEKARESINLCFTISLDRCFIPVRTFYEYSSICVLTSMLWWLHMRVYSFITMCETFIYTRHPDVFVQRDWTREQRNTERQGSLRLVIS